jgi:hypothetical protein
MYRVDTYAPVENRDEPHPDWRYGPYEVHFLNGLLSLRRVRNLTVSDFSWQANQAYSGGGQGYTLALDFSNEVLVSDGHIDRVKKTLSINAEGASSGNVFLHLVAGRHIGGTSPLDFHGRLAMSNLFDGHTTGDDFIEASVRPFESGDGISTSESVFWNTVGTGEPTIPSADDSWDYDNDRNGEVDSEPISDLSIIVSNQYGWGYVIGTRGPFSAVTTAAMPNRAYDRGLDPWRPYILPEDFREGIGYDADPAFGGRELDPPSLYLAQLHRRLCGNEQGCP